MNQLAVSGDSLVLTLRLAIFLVGAAGVIVITAVSCFRIGFRDGFADGYLRAYMHAKIDTLEKANATKNDCSDSELSGIAADGFDVRGQDNSSDPKI